jgi:hypothetical protein
MPFLFVDYDQGAGGEYLSYILSQSPQCQSIDYFKTSTGRYKVSDIFAQEFLKPHPCPTLKKAHNTLYEIVPTHRQTYLGARLLKNVNSLRISNPTNELWDYVKQQQLNKVLLTKEPTFPMFVGLVKILNQTASNTNFLNEINHTMDNLSLILISEGIDPSKENRDQAIKELYTQEEEPDFNYNLVIPYEKLINDPQWVKDAIQTVFKIDVNIDLLQVYKTDFENAQYTPS